ncbi:unnamed protein product [Psylliodes chrysocephalus]|uniref:Uncharacterized protein n=1 Tax=Psylliodes chrysocephalus TaxID=3402493 RepID=A0A9P0D689_9CUCU|nr:unnamed protein product [Psylliodes chrysocephala]
MARVSYLILWNQNVNSIKIEQLDVPMYPELHSTEIILDCVYSMAENENTDLLTVKWFFNYQPWPVYQWIANYKPMESAKLKKLQESCINLRDARRLRPQAGRWWPTSYATSGP